ncbi:30S ribosomal protein S1 [bacterium]|nr:30S ribosomal protein S1 [bacterium]
MEDKDDFEALLEAHINRFKKGDLVTGTVCLCESSGFGVDIGDKTFAFCPQREVDTELKKGDELQFFITDFSDREEKYILSQKKVHQAYIWKDLEKLKEADEVILAEVASCVRGGLIVDVLGIKGFVPSSQIHLKGQEFNIGDKIEVKILTLDAEKESFILSNKKVHSDLDLDAKKNVFEQIEVGQIIKGCVVRIAEFGAFVDIGGVDGLLPLSQMSWKWVEHPSDVLKLGDKVDVEVITVDKNKDRISLSLKSLEEDPWIAAKDKLHEDDVIEGTVTRIKPFGVFLEIFSGVEALLSQKEVEEYEKQNGTKFGLGDTVKAKIVKINLDDRRIALSLT